MVGSHATRCCVVGGGPAGMMLGYLLARAGVEVTVLEKHADFLRDFRGDTVHPSTLRIMDELGLLDAFLQLPHQKLQRLSALFGDDRIQLGDFTGLPDRYAFIALMPQWDFLNFMQEQGKRYPRLRVVMEARVSGLLEEEGRVVGVRGISREGDFDLRASLTVGCDGRHSVVRGAAGLVIEDVAAPIDVLWFRVKRVAGHDADTLARVTPGRFVVTIDRGDYWQCAFVIEKDGAEALRARGLAAFRSEVAKAAPLLAPHVGDLRSWDDVKLLSVRVDRLKRWSREGLLCIGDAAHAMSPIGGVGINLAIQDAVAAANRLYAELREGVPLADTLDSVRRRRAWPTRVTQALQVQLQNNVLAPVLADASAPVHAPLPMRLVNAVPSLQRLLARTVGLGVRSEHVESPEVD